MQTQSFPALRRRLIAGSILCFVVAVACQAAVNLVFSTPGPTPTPTPCPGSGPLHSQHVEDVLINAYCGVSDAQAALVEEYARYSLEHLPDDVKPELTMFAFMNVEQGIDLELQWRKDLGFSAVTRERLRNEWIGQSGLAYYDAIFILVPAGAGNHGASAPLARIVLHELHHVAQSHLAHANSAEAGWLTEGGAQAITHRQMADLGFSWLSFLDPMDPACNFPLSDLERPTYQVPSQCKYDEGEKAVSLLIDQCGEDAYYQLFRESLAGRSMSRIFESVYPFSLADFYAGFDKYSSSGYSAEPVLCTESIKIEPSSTPGK